MIRVYHRPERTRVFFLSLLAGFIFSFFYLSKVDSLAAINAAGKTSVARKEAVKAISGARWPGVIDHLLQRPLPDDPSRGHGFNIHISYPSLGDKTVDGDIRQWVNEIATAFESHLDSSQLGSGESEDIDNQISRFLQDDDLNSDFIFANPVEENNFELFGDYSISRPSKSAISVTFELWNYANNRQTNLDIITLNYNLRNKQRLNFVDIFENPDVALELMSKWTREKLGSRLDAGGYSHMLQTGTMPLIENFSSFALIPGGIRINFQPYQVAPWEAGVQKVDMPLDALLPAGPLLALWDN